MKILLTTTIALGCVLMLGNNQTIQAAAIQPIEGPTHQDNFILAHAHGGGGHGGGAHGHWGGHGGNWGHRGYWAHGGHWGHGWGYGGWHHGGYWRNGVWIGGPAYGYDGYYDNEPTCERVCLPLVGCFNTCGL